MRTEQQLDDTIDLGAVTIETRGQLITGVEFDGGHPKTSSAISDED